MQAIGAPHDIQKSIGISGEMSGPANLAGALELGRFQDLPYRAFKASSSPPPLHVASSSLGFRADVIETDRGGQRGKLFDSREKSRADWERSAVAITEALTKRGYENVRVTRSGHVLYLNLANSHLSNLGLAVGRAMRTVMALAPEDIRAIHVSYTKLDQPIVTYEFFDLQKLRQYFDGSISREKFVKTVLVRYSNLDDVIRSDEDGTQAIGMDNIVTDKDDGVVRPASGKRETTGLGIAPKLGLFYNDPSGKLRYDLAAISEHRRRLGEGLYLDSAATLTLAENVSGVSQPSSLLPHVRSDLAGYKRGNRFKLNRLLVNKYMLSSERWYARASAGIYEEMYRGAGGQVLFLPKDSRWAVDLSVDALQQRGFDGWLGKRDYRTVTAVGTLHYRLPYGITATTRMGRFLAKDVGVRGELKRRFSSGVEIGAWLSRSKGRDVHASGMPVSSYSEQGIFISIPLPDSLGAGSLSNPVVTAFQWARDAGQMVESPGDIYDLLDGPRRDMNTFDGLGNFAERADEQDHPVVNSREQAFGNLWTATWKRIEDSSSALPSSTEFLKGAGIAAGAFAVASLSDKAVDRVAKNHVDSRFSRGLGKFGKAMPTVMVGAAGLAAALGDERMRNTSLISLQSAALSLGLSVGAKHATGRAAPEEERGRWARAESRSNSSFAPRHASVIFAAVTPYAKEYDAPWLYGAAVLGSTGGVATRKHWFSDAVIGGILGYATGSWLWDAQRHNSKSFVSFNTGTDEVAVTWQKSY